jgi:hypothetical protein
VSVEIYENPFSNLMIFHQHQAPVENLTLVNLAEAEELFPPSSTEKHRPTPHLVTHTLNFILRSKR